MLFVYLHFIDFFFDIAIYILFFFYFCHVRGKFMRMEDKMEMKTILITSLKIVGYYDEHSVFDVTNISFFR